MLIDVVQLLVRSAESSPLWAAGMVCDAPTEAWQAVELEPPLRAPGALLLLLPLPAAAACPGQTASSGCRSGDVIV